jgi:hypothetical protein
MIKTSYRGKRMRELFLFAFFSLSAARNARVAHRPKSQSLHLYCLALSLGLLATSLANAACSISWNLTNTGASTYTYTFTTNDYNNCDPGGAGGVYSDALLNTGSVTTTASGNLAVDLNTVNVDKLIYTPPTVGYSGTDHATLYDANSNTFPVTIVVIAPPSAPTIGTATAGNAQASVSFTAPGSNGNSTITAYTVTSTPGGATTSGAASPLTVTGLSNGTPYTFKVTATNAAGTSTASSASNSVIPTAPQIITFANPGPQNFGTSPTLTATATSGLSVSFTSSTTAVCTITSGGALTFITTGPCTINADQVGNAAYQAAPTVSRTFSVNAVPDLTIAKSHTGNFTQGQTGATYTITASNIGSVPSNGTVTVTDTLPSGLTATAISGTGWSCTLGTLTCTRSDALAAGSSYPVISLAVNVANNAAASVTNMATVSGGGETNTANDTANDATTVNPPTYSVGNFVWLDSNNDGRFDNGEAGIANVLVELLDGTGTVVGTETTDHQGYYRFDNIPAGSNYQIFIPGSNFTGAGALNGLTVSSITHNGHNAASDDSWNHGLYTTDPVAAGVASLSFNVPYSSSAPSEPTGETVNSPGVSTYSGNGPGGDAFDDLTVDFGFTQAYSIGNYVWKDTNNNGVVDAGETGVAGVQVQLFDSSSNFITAMSTDASGYYRFDYIASGNYYVRIPQSNFISGALVGYLPSSVVDNGHAITDDNQNHGSLVSGGSQSAIFAVPVAAGEPTGEITSGSTHGGNGPTGDANDDLTIDFGFALPAASTTTSMTSGPAGNTPYGSQTPYVATVTVSGGGTATGAVTFCDTTGGTCSATTGPNIIGTVTLTNASNNVASLVPTVPLSIGTHTIIANYAGDSTHAVSTTTNSIVTNIVAVNTTTSYTLTPGGGSASAPPITVVFSQPVSSTATVTAQAGGGTPTGTVQYAEDGTNVGSAATLSGGSTTPTSLGSSLAVGNHTVSAAYTPASGTGWNASTGNNGGATAIVVNQAGTTVATSLASGAGTGTPTFGVTMTGTAPATANPTSGSVTLYDGTPGNAGASTLLGTGPLTGTNSVLITSTVTLTSAGNPHNIWAAFAGNVSFNAGNSTGESYSVTAPTATTVQQPTGPTSFAYGQSVSYTGTVTAASGTTNPGGAANSGNTLSFCFALSATPSTPVLCSSGRQVLNTASPTVGQASYAVPANTQALTPGSYVLTTTYHNQDGLFTNSGPSSPLNVTVNKAGAPFTISSTVPAGQSLTVTQNITVTATYTSSLTPNPTGSVTFLNSANGAAPICSATLTNGVAFCTATAGSGGAAGLQPGPVTITISYAGDSNYTLGTVTPESVTVALASQTISFTSTPPANPMVTGTYTVSATGGASNNAVTFTIDATSSAGACTIAGNVVSFTGTGSCIVDANQAGNASYAAAPQARQTIVVGKKTTIVTLAATPNPTVTGVPVTLTATVTGDPPTGTVSFADNSVTLPCSPVTLVVGATSSTATCTSTFTAGTHSVTATYNGDGNFVQATSSIFALLSDPPLMPAPMLDRWAMLLCGLLAAALAFVQLRRS